MKKLLSFILLLFVLLGSCRPAKEAPMNEGPTLFSRLRDSEYWRERYLETFWKEEKAKFLKYFYEAPLIDEQDITLSQSFIKPWLDFYHLDLH